MKQKYISKIISVVLMITVSFAHQQIETIKTIEDSKISTILTDLNPRNSIVLFDCDDVLFHSKDAVLQREALPQLMQFLTSQCSVEDLAEIIPEVTRSAQKELVEPAMLSVVQDLQDKNIPTFVLTQCSSDDVVRKERFEKLSNLGINFSSSLPGICSYELVVPEDKLQLKPFQTHTTKPIYDSGIIYCGSAPKGLVLSEFLKFVPIKCSVQELQIVFIDDAERNLTDVGVICSDLGIGQYIGIHYTAIEKIHKQIYDEVLRTQIRHLLSTDHRLIDDNTAKYALGLTNPFPCF